MILLAMDERLLYKCPDIIMAQSIIAILKEEEIIFRQHDQTNVKTVVRNSIVYKFQV